MIIIFFFLYHPPPSTSLAPVRPANAKTVMHPLMFNHQPKGNYVVERIQPPRSTVIACGADKRAPVCNYNEMAREPRDEDQHQDPFVEFMHTLQHFIAIFLEYTWYIIREILYVTLDIVCLVLLIISCACPTRTLVAPYVYLKELCRNPVATLRLLAANKSGINLS